MDFYSIIARAHIAAGALSLISLWVVIVLPKGRASHRFFGRAFLLSMCGVGVTTVPLVVGVYRHGYRVWAAFLIYLTIFVGTHCWTAWRAVREKGNRQAYCGLVYRVLAVVNLCAGLAILGLGAATGRVLLIGFSFAGIFAGAANLGFAYRGSTEDRWWLREHTRGMLNNAIATHISFLTLGLGRLVPSIAGDTLMTAGWIGTLSIGICLRVALEVILAPSRTRPPAELTLTAEPLENSSSPTAVQ